MKKRNHYALKIQKAWKVYRLRLYSDREKIKKFREVFFGGRIAWFIFKKYFKDKQPKPQIEEN